MPRAARGRARGTRVVGAAATCFDSLTNQRRRTTFDPGQSATCLACVARQAVCLTSRCRLVRCAWRDARPCVVRCARVAPEAETAIAVVRAEYTGLRCICALRRCVTHSQHFPRIDSCDASDAAWRGNRARMIVAAGRVRAARCTDKSAESRRRKAFRKMKAVRWAIDARHACAIRRTTSSDGSRGRPAVYRCRADPSMRRPVAVVKHSVTHRACAVHAVRTGPACSAAGLNIAGVEANVTNRRDARHSEERLMT